MTNPDFYEFSEPKYLYSIINKKKPIESISWSPQYDLNILSDDCRHTFQSFAEITNGTKQEYKINRTELFGGDVCLQKENGTKRRRNRSRSRSRSLSDTSDDDDDEDEFNSIDIIPTIGVLGELAGLYLYSIDQPFLLLPNSSFVLPFINATIQISKCVSLTLPFSSHTQIRKLQRKYCIESIDKFLLTASITIRATGHLAGVTTLPNMDVSDKHTFSYGQDPDVTLNRQVKLISKERHSAMYAVHLTFKNVKSIPVKFEYREIIDNSNTQSKIIIKGSDEQRAQIQVIENGIQIENKNSTDNHHSMLAANGGEQIYEYEINLNHSKKSNSYRKRRREE
ncbi:unnamed protein product [Rotaria sp. Silwood2]|nr:unnamed protein product [Rotaria sp. Silwood2]